MRGKDGAPEITAVGPGPPDLLVRLDGTTLYVDPEVSAENQLNVIESGAETLQAAARAR